MTEATLVYDDDCGFCTFWAEYVENRSDIRLVGFSDLDRELLELLPENYETCSHLLVDGTRYSCGASIEEALARTDGGPHIRPAVDHLRRFDSYERAREWGYRQVADNRSFWGQFLSKTPPVRRDSSSTKTDGESAKTDGESVQARE